MADEFDPKWFDESFYRGSKGSKRDVVSPFYHFFVGRVLSTYKDKSYEGMKLLDIGCGMGLRTSIYRNHKIDAHGFDVSEWAKKNSILPPKRHTCGDARRVDEFFEKDFFDLVVPERVMAYLPKEDAEATVQKLTSLTKKDIIFSIICADHLSEARVKGGQPGRINIAPKSFWLKCFEKAGLEINEEKTAIMCAGGWDCIWFLERKNAS